jgi:uncharacterized protein YbbK (DUF523 family)
VVKIMVSACLCGEPTRYDGGRARFPHSILDRWLEEGRAVAFCPEIAGGLSVPRPAAEIFGGDGPAVLTGRARVFNREGRDVSAAFIQGARETLTKARSQKIAFALLKDSSPSCGNTTIYDGTFSGRKREGAGVAAAMLMQSGIRVFNEKQIEQAETFLSNLMQNGAGT